MLEHRGIWLPDHERHLQGWMDRIDRVVDGLPTYQYHKLEAALRYVTNWTVAVDIGAHCGLWSMHLVRKFSKVLAFEPVSEHLDCLDRNVTGAMERHRPRCQFDVHSYALGMCEQKTAMHRTPGSSGDSWPEGAGDVAIKVYDREVGTEEAVGFVKADCEGYELFALRGMEHAIRKHHPVICVEQKPGKAQQFGLGEIDAVLYLESLGAKVRREMAGDYILSW